MAILFPKHRFESLGYVDGFDAARGWGLRRGEMGDSGGGTGASLRRGGSEF